MVERFKTYSPAMWASSFLSRYYLILGLCGCLTHSLTSKAALPGVLRVWGDTSANKYQAVMAVQPDGRVLVASPLNRGKILERFTAEGVRDSSFIHDFWKPQNSYSTGASIRVISVQLDGSILIAGSFGGVDWMQQSNLIRFRPDGQLDPSFRPRMTNDVISLAVQSDGKILVLSGSSLFRLNSNGTADTAFRQMGLMFGAESIHSLADGRFIVSYGSSAVESLRLFSAEGIADTLGLGLQINSGSGHLLQQPDGKILVTDSLNTYGLYVSDGITFRNNFARLTLAGGVDSGFQSSFPGHGNSPNLVFRSADSMLLMANGAILLGGVRQNPNSYLKDIATLDASGNETYNWASNLGDFTDFGPSVQGMCMRGDGSVVVSDGIASLGLIEAQPSTETLTCDENGVVSWLRAGPLPEVSDVLIQSSQDGGQSWTSLPPVSRISGGWQTTFAGTPPATGGLRALGKVRTSSVGGVGDGWVEKHGWIGSARPEIEVRRMNGEELQSGAGSQVLDMAGETLVLQITNSGSAPLQLQPFRVSGALPECFRVDTSQMKATLPAGATTTFEVTYLPSISEEAPTATLTLPSNDEDEPAFTVPLEALRPQGSRIDLTSFTAWFPYFPLSSATIDGSVRNFALNIPDYARDLVMSLRYASSPVGRVSVSLNGVPEANPEAISIPLSQDLMQNFRLRFSTQSPDVNEEYNFTIFRTLSLPGQPDPSVSPQDRAGSTMINLPDNGWLSAGSHLMIQGQPRIGLARWNPDANLAPAFGPGLNNVLWVRSRKDGGYIIGGQRTNLDTQVGTCLKWLREDGQVSSHANVPAVTRLEQNGTLSLNHEIQAALERDEDGGLWLGGRFNLVGRRPRSHLVLLDAYGNVDESFNAGLSAGIVRCLLRLNDGSLLVGGEGLKIASNPATFVLLRLDARTGKQSPAPIVSGQYVSCMALLPDGKVLIGGSFYSVSGTQRYYIARLNADLTHDVSFIPPVPSGENPVFPIRSLALQCDGKVITGGYVRRLTTSGAIDSTFFSGRGSANDMDIMQLVSADAVAVQKSGRIILQPDNFSYHYNILLNDPATETLSVPSPSRVQWLRGGTSPEAAKTWFDLSTDGGGTWTRLGAGTRISGGWELSGLRLPANGEIRARALTPSGLNNASTGIIETRQSFTLGTPELVVSASGQGVLASGASHDFGTVGLPGGSAEVLAIQLENSGLTFLPNLNVNLSGPGAAAFRIIDVAPASLDSGGSFTLHLAFQPSALGSYSALLNLSHGGLGSPFTLQLQGSAVTAIPPRVQTLAASAITATSATVAADLQTEGPAFQVWVDYGITKSLGATVPATPAVVDGNGSVAASVGLSGLQGHTLYYYRFRLRGPLGSAIGKTLSFSTANRAPRAESDSYEIASNTAVFIPVMQNDTDADGDNLTLVSVTQPSSGGKTSSRGSGVLFTPNALPLSAAVTFSYTIRDSRGATSSSQVSILTGSVNAPSLVEVTPPGGSIKVAVTAPGTLWTASENLSWLTIHQAHGIGNGDVVLQVQPNAAAVERSGVISIGGQSVTIRQAAVASGPTVAIEAGSSFDVVVAQPFHLSLSVTGHPLKLSARFLPPGIKLSAAGVLSGTFSKQGTYASEITAQNAAGTSEILRVTFNVSPLAPGLAGVWQGFVSRHSELNQNLGSRFELTLTSTGAASGSLITGISRLKFKASLNAAVASANRSSINIHLPRSNSTPLNLQIRLDHAKGTAVGLLSHPSSNVAVEFHGWRSANANSTPQAADFSTPFHLALTNPDESVDLPQGVGFARFTPSPTQGRLQFSGLLADGSILNSSAVVGLGGQVLLYQYLSGNGGTLAGVLSVPQVGEDALTAYITGSPTWLKLPASAKSKDRAYRRGFGPIPLLAAGRRFTVAAGSVVPGASATLGFSHFGNLNDSNLNVPLQVRNPKPSGYSNVFTFQAASNLQNVSLQALDILSGRFNGAFNIPPFSGTVPLKVSFHGLMISNGNGYHGQGYFLRPTDSGKQAPLNSCRVDFTSP